MSTTTTTKKESRQRFTVAAGLAAGAKGGDVAALRRFLARFGYLDSNAHADDGDAPAAGNGTAASANGSAGDVFDDELEAAVKRYQEFNHLPVTGVVDQATADRIAMPRCGVPDVGPLSDGGPAAFALTGGRWNTTTLRYAYNNLTQDLSNAAVRQSLHQAFSTWAGWVNLTFTEVPLNANPEMIVSFETGDHGDGSPFDGAGSADLNILAHGFFPPNGVVTPIQGDLHFDDFEQWTVTVPPGANQFDLTTIAIHEIGHCLGLRHSTVVGAVMEALYAGPRRTLHSDDIQGMTSIYGSPPLFAAMWTHGSSASVEYPERLAIQRPIGWGLRICGKPNTTNWVHFAIPTPVIWGGDRKAIGPCLLRLRTAGAAAMVRDVHIYDGDTRLAAHNDVRLTGWVPFSKFGVAEGADLKWGVGISVGVEFGADPDPASRQIEFFAAGCDFRP